jgi:acetyltransferase
MKEILHHILNPESVALIGVSKNPDSFGYPFVEIAQRYGYAGELHIVNPNSDTILGLKCYSGIMEIPGKIDVAMIIVPKKHVSSSVEDCIKKGVKGIVIITAGFAEQNQEGRILQEELVKKAVSNGIRIIGPNTLGYYSAPSNLDLIMSGFIKKGNTALIAQSGNLTQSITFPGAQRGLGFSYVIGLGNQADLQFHDFIRYFREDNETKVIAVHIEGLRDGRRFMEEVRKTVQIKPVVVLKSGRTEAGARVASTHTASVAGNDEIYKAAFKQCGAIQVENFTEFISAILAFNTGKTAKGNRMCIISEGGGDCVLTSDACIRKGLTLPGLSETTKNRLLEIINKNGSVENPIDLAGWEHVVHATEIVLEDNSIDGIIIVGGFGGNFHISPNDYLKEEKYVRQMCILVAGTKKPVAIYSYSSYKENKLVDILRENNIPLFMDHHDAVNAMAALVKYEKIKTGLNGRSFQGEWEEVRKPVITNNGDKAKEYIPEPVAKQMLQKYNLQYPEERLAGDLNEADKYAGEIGYPVALKIVSGDIVHKSDAGCVKLGLKSRSEVREAFSTIISNALNFNSYANISGVLVSRMDTEEGVEIIIGGLNDPVFGPVIMFGMGGIFVEIMKDVSFRICPVNEADAEEMIREISGFPLLAGTRGKPVMDLAGIRDALINVSRLLMENPRITEVDLNPVKVHRKGLMVLDARILTVPGY